MADKESQIGYKAHWSPKTQVSLKRDFKKMITLNQENKLLKMSHMVHIKYKLCRNYFFVIKF